MSPVSQGDRVFHPNLKDWGLGKVLRVYPEHVDVFFVGVGSKRLSKSFVKLEVAEGAAAKHPLLDNLMEASQIADANYLTLPAAIDRFLTNYPEGLEGKAFLKEEREATLRGHQFFTQLLGQEELSRLISEGGYQDVCDRARHVESVTSLLTKTEKSSLYAALDLPVNQKVFSEGLADALYGSAPEDERFSRFIRTLHLMELAKWPFATLFGFIRFPQERVFIKPTATQNAAKAFCWRINYRPEPNWKTYSSVVRFYNHIRTGLVEEGLMPRDLIDVQAIIWLAGQK